MPPANDRIPRTPSQWKEPSTSISSSTVTRETFKNSPIVTVPKFVTNPVELPFPSSPTNAESLAPVENSHNQQGPPACPPHRARAPPAFRRNRQRSTRIVQGKSQCRYRQEKPQCGPRPATKRTHQSATRRTRRNPRPRRPHTIARLQRSDRSNRHVVALTKRKPKAIRKGIS